MLDQLKDFPARIAPYILTTKPDEPVLLLPGPFRLIGAAEARLNADLKFRWSPSVAVEIEGEYVGPLILPDEMECNLVPEGEHTFSVPIHITNSSSGTNGSFVRGLAARPFSIGEGPFEVLRFCLANFPDFIGKIVRYESEGGDGSIELIKGRLEMSAESGCCQVDKIPEAKELVSAVERDAGFVISHVGLWIPSAGAMDALEAESIIRMLHFWFGLLRGAWAGPLFPQGVNSSQVVVWQQFASWKLRGSRKVSTWLPNHARLDLSSAFQGFVDRWNDATWRDPLTTAISWFVESNAPETARESRIVLAQVALELLSSVLLVESQHVHRSKDFEVMSAAGRIRTLLHHLGIPTAIPTHLKSLQSLCDTDAFDGPGVITKVRNALVHSTKRKRAFMESVDGEQRMECSELALQYLELTLLAICGHDGHYARRGRRGWKGDDEVVVPWS